MGIRFGDSGAFTWLSGSDEGNLSIAGNITASTIIETAYSVSGAISSALGITGSSIQVNDSIFLNAKGTISASTSVASQDIYANYGGTNSARLLATGEISGSGPLNIVGAATIESTLHVTGAITTAAGVTASAGVSGAYGNFNTIGVNDAGTHNITLAAGVLSNTGYFDVTEMSAPGNPASNVGRLYVADDSGTTKLYFKDSGGTATSLLAGGLSQANQGNNRVVTSVDASNINAEANLTFDGSKLSVTGEISGSGVLNVVGAATLEGVLNVTGAISTAAGITASAGLSASYAFVNNLGVNDGGTKTIQLEADGTSLFGGKMTVSDEISGSGPLNIVGAATLESTLHVTGAIATAAGITASVGVSSSYGFLNRLQINGGGTKSIKLKGNGVIEIAGGAADTTCLSASGDVNIVGKTFIENTLNVTGAISCVGIVSSAVGLTGSSLLINDVGLWNANGNLGTAGAISGALGISGSSLQVNDSAIISPNGNATFGGGIRAKFLHYDQFNFDFGGTTEVFVPMDRNPTESGNDNSQGERFVVPYDGRVVKILIRTENAAGDPTLIRLYKSSDGTERPSQTGTPEQGSVDLASGHTTVTSTFSGSQHFSAGDVIGVSVQAAAAPGEVNMTIVYEYDMRGEAH